MTPEMLLSLAARDFTDRSPEALNIISASPIDTQDCESCPMLGRCGSTLRRVRDKLICFEKLPVAVAAIIAVLGISLISQPSATVTTAPAVIEPPPLVEPATLPDTTDNYLKPKMRAKFAKPRKRRKHAATRDDNPIMVAWNTVVRAGYRNASR